MPAGGTGVRGRPTAPRKPGPLAHAAIRLVVRAADALTALLGAGPAAGRERISEAQLRDLVAASTALDPVERRIIDEVLTAGGRMVREVMIPRTDVVFLDSALRLDAAARLVRLAPHTRYPVIDGTHDDVVGLLHLHDLLIRPAADPRGTVGELAREVKRLPGSKRVLAALSEMRREGHHLAVVADEYGGTAGIVTLEDLIEELVGEIHDGSMPATHSSEQLDGRLNLPDFTERTGLILPPGPYETVGGFVMATLGRIPAEGDAVSLPDAPAWTLRVILLEGRRIARLALIPADPPGPED